MRQSRKILALAAICAGGFSQPTSGSELPPPEKPDTPYIIHATTLVETERNEARQEQRKKELYYYVEGASSGVVTPLASPEFLFRSQEIEPRALRLFGFEAVKGRRELLFQKKDKILARPKIFKVVGEEGDGVYRLRADEFLTAGEYCLTPDGSDAVFCFTVQ